MRDNIKYLIIFTFLLALVTSCGTQKVTNSNLLYDPSEVAELSRKLGVKLSNLDREDDRYMPLYVESSFWLGTPYRGGGLSRRGVDCSGFTYLIYEKVFKKKIPRSTSELSRMKMKKVSQKDLETGDLVFFATSSKNKINHVGIYLKDGYFVHASTSRGVIVSHLYEDYYRRTWKKGGRIR